MNRIKNLRKIAARSMGSRFVHSLLADAGWTPTKKGGFLYTGTAPSASDIRWYARNAADFGHMGKHTRAAFFAGVEAAILPYRLTLEV